MAARRRAGTVSVGTVGAIAALKPRPPSSPRSSLCDVTNGAAGLLSGKAGGSSADGELARLSDKILNLMSQLHARDDQVRKLEKSLEVAQKEAANAKALLNTATSRGATPPASANDPSARSRVPAPRPATGNSPARKDVQLRVLSAALREADLATAMKAEELAAARAMLAHRPPGGAGSSSDGAPAPGVVARLQAELAEAAEERRSLRQQLQALRDRLKEVQNQLAERAAHP